MMVLHCVLTFLVIKTSEQVPQNLFMFHFRFRYCFWLFGDIHLPGLDYTTILLLLYSLKWLLFKLLLEFLYIGIRSPICLWKHA